ncbi:MAG: ComEC/Rec2 family competence protein [Steroidobacteraceae bacterium]
MLPGIAFFAGHLIALLAVAPLSSTWCGCAFAAAVLAWWRVGTRRYVAAVRLLAAGVAGFALLSWTVGAWLTHRLPLSDHDERLLVTGMIVSVPARAGDEVSFDARVQILAPRDRVMQGPLKLRVRWHGAPPVLLAHETWQWLLRVDTHSRSLAVDLDRIWLRDRVHALAVVLPSPLNVRERIAPRSIDALRERIARAIDRSVVDRDAAALIRALAVGLTDQMTREQWRVFAATGTTHLVAISGLHVTLFALVAFAVARALWRWLPAWLVPCDREPFALTAGVVAALGYALLAGWSVPTQRTLLMLGVFAVLRLQQRSGSVSQVLLAALVGVLLLDPLAPLAAGLWLSFGAVAAILWVEVPRIRRVPNTWAALRVQGAIVIALAPATVAMFGSMSLSAVIVNAIAIPAISFVLVPIVLLGSLVILMWPQGGGQLLRVAESCYEFGWPSLARAAEWPLSLVLLEPSLWWYPLALVALARALAPIALRVRIATSVALLPLLGPGAAELSQGMVRATLFDTGRGVLVALRTARHAVLYDTGDSFNSAGRPLEALLTSGTLAPPDARFDLVVLPRVTQDRAAGIGRLVTHASIGELRGGGAWPGSVLPYRPCQDGDVRILDGVSFELLVGASGARRYCALRITTAAQALLLAGEFDRSAERDAVRRAATRGHAGVAHSLASDVLLVSRRGSGAGSSREWRGAVAPSVAIVTGPRATRVTSPRAVVLRDWRASGARLLETESRPVVSVRLGAAGEPRIGSPAESRYAFLWRRPVAD